MVEPVINRTAPPPPYFGNFDLENQLYKYKKSYSIKRRLIFVIFFDFNNILLVFCGGSTYIKPEFCT